MKKKTDNQIHIEFSGNSALPNLIVAVFTMKWPCD